MRRKRVWRVRKCAETFDHDALDIDMANSMGIGIIERKSEDRMIN